MSAVRFLCWTNNCRSRSDYGLYVMHASGVSNRTLCGCKIQEHGELISTEIQPSCKRCQRALVAKGVLKAESKV